MSEVYQPKSSLLKDDLHKLTAGALGQKWDLRYVVLTPMSVHIYKGPTEPAVGTKPKTVISLTAGAQVEIVQEGEIDNWRPFSFSIVPEGSTSENVLAANDEESFHLWLDMLHRQSWLAADATARGCTLDTQGNYLDKSGKIITTAEAVLTQANEEYANEQNALDNGSVSESNSLGSTSQSSVTQSSITQTTASNGTKDVKQTLNRTGGSTGGGSPKPPSVKSGKDSGFSPELLRSPSRGERTIQQENQTGPDEGQPPVITPIPINLPPPPPPPSNLPPPPLPPSTTLPPPPVMTEPVNTAALPPPPAPLPGPPITTPTVATPVIAPAPAPVPILAPAPAPVAVSPPLAVLPPPTTVLPPPTTVLPPPTVAPTPTMLPPSDSSTNPLASSFVANRDTSIEAGARPPVEAPRRPVNRELDPVVMAEINQRMSKATGSRVRGKITDDIPAAPPAPPERGGVSRPSTTAEPVNPLTSSLIGTPGATILPGSRSHIPSSAITPHGVEMPKPKFRAWAETGGVPVNLATASEINVTRPRVPGTASNIVDPRLAALRDDMLHTNSPSRSYPHGFAAGQRGLFEGAPIEFSLTSSRGIPGIGLNTGTADDDDDASSTVGSIAGVPTSMADNNAGRVTFSLPPNSAASQSGLGSSSASVRPPTESGLSLTTVAPSYSYPRMGGVAPTTTNTNSGPVIVPPPSGNGNLNTISQSAPIEPGQSLVPGTRILQPRKLPEMVTPLPKAAAVGGGVPNSKFANANDGRGGTGSPTKGTTNATIPPTNKETTTTAPTTNSPNKNKNPVLEVTAQAIDAATAAAERAAAEVAAILNGQSPDRRDRPTALEQSPNNNTPSNRRSRGQSLDNGLEALDDVNIDARSIVTADTYDVGGNIHGNDHTDGATTVYTASTLRTVGGTALPFQPLKTVPMREVRRTFDTMTANSEGLLPLSKLPSIADKLGMPLEVGYMQDPSNIRDLDPTGEGVISRNDFMSWWKRHAVMRVKQLEAEMMRRAALEAVRAKEGDAVVMSARERRAARRRHPRNRSRSRSLTRDGNTTDASTVITTTDTADTYGTYNDTEIETATQSTATRAYVQAANNNSSMIAPLAAEAEAALKVLEEGLAATLESAEALMAELNNDGKPKVPAPESAIEETKESKEDEMTTSELTTIPSQSPPLLTEVNNYPVEKVPEDIPEDSGALSSSLLQVPPAPTNKTVHDRLAAVTEAVKSNQPPSWLSKYGKNTSSSIALVASAAAADLDASLTQAAQGGLARNSPMPKNNKETTMDTSGLGGIPDSMKGAITAVVAAAVTTALGGELPEGVGKPTSVSLDANYLIPLPDTVPSTVHASLSSSSSPSSSKTGLGLSHSLSGANLLTAEVARFPNMQPQVAETLDIDGSSKENVDLYAVHRQIMDQPLADYDLNEMWQRCLEAPEWTVGDAAVKGIAAASFLGRFANSAIEAAEKVILEQGLPDAVKTLPPINLEAAIAAAEGHDNSTVSSTATSNADAVYMYKGILLRIAQAPSTPGDPEVISPTAYTSIPSSVDTLERKIAGHTLRGLRLATDTSLALYRDWASAAGTPDQRRNNQKRRPPPLATVLTAILDYGGFRLYAMAVPPMEENLTLVYGTLGHGAPFVQKSPVIASMLRRVAKHLNLKPHAVQTLTLVTGSSTNEDGSTSTTEMVGDRTIVIPLSVDVQGHQCADSRLYLVNVARLMPADISSINSNTENETQDTPSAVALSCQLRPELVRNFSKPLSSDAYRVTGSVTSKAADALTIGAPPDAAANDGDVARASSYLINEVIPNFVQKLENGELLGFAAMMDSSIFTNSLHNAGINVRYLGRLATLATSPHIQELLEIEMVARTTKHILAKNQRRMVRRAATAAAVSTLSNTDSHNLAINHAKAVRNELMGTTVDLFNLVLGTSDDALSFWKDILAPAVTAKFGYNLRWENTLQQTNNNELTETNLDASMFALSGLTPKTSSSPRGVQTPFHKPQLFMAMQYHCGVQFQADLPPLPTSTLSLATSSTKIMTNTTDATITVRPNDPMLTNGMFDTLSSIAPLAYQAVPSSTSTTFLGVPASASSNYDFTLVEPFKFSDLHSLTPTASSLRTLSANHAIETSILSTSAETLESSGQIMDALHAYNIRLALLQALGSADAAADTMEAANVLLDIGRLQLSLGLYNDVLVTTLAALARVSGRHVISARALLLRAQALVGLNNINDGLQTFTQAILSITYHLGKQHPAISEFNIIMANTLSSVGKYTAAAYLALSSAEIANKVLGASHIHVVYYYTLSGHLFSIAANEGYKYVQANKSNRTTNDNNTTETKTNETKDDETQHVRTTLTRLYSNNLLNHAVEVYERALILLENMANEVNTTNTSNASLNTDTLLIREGLGTLMTNLANVLTYQGKLASATTAATRGLNIRKDICPNDYLVQGINHNEHITNRYYLGVIQSLQQVAALADRNDKPLDALNALEIISDAIKTSASLSSDALAAVQRTVRHIIRLGFRAINTHHRSLLQKLAMRHYTENKQTTLSTTTLSYVISLLLQSTSPFTYVKDVATRALAALGSNDNKTLYEGNVPSLADQLCALISMLALPKNDTTTGEGGDITSENGSSVHSDIGKETSFITELMMKKNTKQITTKTNSLVGYSTLNGVQSLLLTSIQSPIDIHQAINI